MMDFLRIRCKSFCYILCFLKNILEVVSDGAELSLEKLPLMYFEIFNISCQEYLCFTLLLPVIPV